MSRGVALTLCAAHLAAAVKLKVTPTQQVINMLTDMKNKGQQSLEEEEKVYAQYNEWKSDEATRLRLEIQDGARKIEELVAFIEKTNSNSDVLGEEIASLNGEIVKLEGERSDAAKDRAAQHTEFFKLAEDYSESVDALKRAIATLSAQDYDRPQAEMLLQRMATTIPGMTRVLAAFEQQKSHSSLRGDGAPAVAAYEFQAGGIVDLLQSLYDKFRQELQDLQKGEANQQHAFNLLELDLKSTISRDTSDRDEKAIAKKKAEAASARAQGELADTRSAKAADEKTKQDMEAVFEQKTAQYHENQKIREAELEAIAKAIEIISSPAVAGSYAKHVNDALAQTGHSVSFLQVGLQASTVNRARALLVKRAQALGSKELAELAANLQANPFEKVIGMIEDLVAKLKEQASAEAEHKAWCDEQLKKNKLKRNQKTAEVNALIAEVQNQEATIADMGATIAQLAKEQAELTAAMQKATEVREVEKKENLATIADSKAGFDAVGKALVVLKEFYASQASLLQQVPEMAAYKGQQASNKGVVGMLEVIQTDFARLRADTESAEDSAAREYGTFMKDSEATNKQKHDEEFKLKLDKDQVEFERENTKKDLSRTEEELDKANDYYESLKPSCVVVHVSWEERVAKRKEEIAALKEAYAILDQHSSE